MKLHRSFLPAIVAAVMLLAPFTLRAEEKADVGPVPTPEEKQAAEALSKRGALVQTLAAGVNWSYVNFRGVEKPDSATFALIGKIPSIVELDLSGSQFQAADLAGVATLKNLKKLNLSRSNASDAVLAHLKSLAQLESLNLFHTDVTDAGLQQLAGLKNLKRLYVFETKVTDAGAASLAKALPTLRIERGWDLKLLPAPVAAAAPPAKPEPPKPPQPKPEPPKPAPVPAPKPEPPKPAPVPVPAPTPAPKPAALAAAKPEEAGMDSAKLAAIKPAMEELLKQKRAAGVVTLVVRDGRIVHQEAAGMANLETKKAMTPDAIFWIASMTKSLTSTAVQILVDEGKLTLDEPAAKWLPELAKVKVGKDGALARPITLRDLLSHTSGIADPPRKPSDGNVPIAQYSLDLLKEPFEFQPGSKFEYGFGLTVAGRIVEIVSGKSFEQFVGERIIAPLGMKDTTWHPDAAQRARVARTYKLGGDALVPAHNAFLTSEPDIRREAEPSGGLFSTAADMARFYQMVLNGGELDGKRIVSAKGVTEMTKAHAVAGKAIQYGLGWFNNAAEKKTTPHMSDKSFGHGGAFGTLGWVDPEKKMIVVFMVQNVLVPKGGELRDKFLELAAGAVK
jgi:CubicO group peptidase (beta-lactamase class C family)